MSDDDADAVKAVDGITDYGELLARQQSRFEWTVLHLREDAAPSSFLANTRKLECSCPDHQYNREDGEVCKHLAVALYESRQRMETPDDAMWAMATMLSDGRSALNRLEEAADWVDTVAKSEAAADAAESARDGSDDDSTDDDDDGGVVSEATPNEADSALIDQLAKWFDQAADFQGFDPDIIELSWVNADGTEGIEVDRNPFQGDDPYYDDGEWIDKDAFDEEKDKVKDVILSPRDEFEWYGEPDYAWFIPAEKVSEVVG